MTNPPNPSASDSAAKLERWRFMQGQRASMKTLYAIFYNRSGESVFIDPNRYPDIGYWIACGYIAAEPIATDWIAHIRPENHWYWARYRLTDKARERFERMEIS